MSESRRCPQCDAEIPVNSPAGLCPRCLLKASADSQSAAASAEPGPTKLTPPASGFVPPTVEKLAPLFPQLEILELLGKGGVGAVYKARQPGLDRLVALKILPPEISHDPAFAERFQREARALARLSHPHIVGVYDFGQTFVVPPSGGSENPPASQGIPPKGGTTNGLCYIVMEFVDGANLRQAIKAGKLTAAEALAIVPQICEALQFAHDEGIVHRDIKPENILIDKRGRVKIADFGLAKLLGQDASDHSLTATHQVMGTLRYMAPEQMQGSREVDHRADIYSLGVVFYELLTGELPMGRFAPPSKRVQVDVRLDEIVLRALEQQPEQRYQHASQIKSDVESVTSTPIVLSSATVAGHPQDSARTVSADRSETQLSRCALVGAIWSPLFFIAAGASMISTTQTTSEYTGPAWWQLALGFTLLPLGVLAPFGTTILGVIGIGKIKRSEGKLYGLELAAADMLLFPLLVLFGAIAVGLALALHSLFSIQLAVAGVPAAIVAAVVCFFVGRAAWRASVPSGVSHRMDREQVRGLTPTGLPDTRNEKAGTGPVSLPPRHVASTAAEVGPRVGDVQSCGSDPADVGVCGGTAPGVHSEHCASLASVGEGRFGVGVQHGRRNVCREHRVVPVEAMGEETDARSLCLRPGVVRFRRSLSCSLRAARHLCRHSTDRH